MTPSCESKSTGGIIPEFPLILQITDSIRVDRKAARSFQLIFGPCRASPLFSDTLSTSYACWTLAALMKQHTPEFTAIQVS